MDLFSTGFQSFFFFHRPWGSASGVLGCIRALYTSLHSAPSARVGSWWAFHRSRGFLDQGLLLHSLALIPLPILDTTPFFRLKRPLLVAHNPFRVSGLVIYYHSVHDIGCSEPLRRWPGFP